MIALQLLCDWLSLVPTELGHRFEPGPRQPEYGRGDKIGLVTLQPGPGLALEALADQPSFEVKMTAREFQHAKLERDVFAIDRALLFADYPDDLWGSRVQYVTRVGGAPAPIQEDEMDRVAYVCSYVVHEMPEM